MPENTVQVRDSSSSVNTVLIVIVLIILVGGGVWWYKTYRTPADPAPSGGLQINIGGSTSGQPSDGSTPQTQ